MNTKPSIICNAKRTTNKNKTNRLHEKTRDCLLDTSWKQMIPKRIRIKLGISVPAKKGKSEERVKKERERRQTAEQWSD